MKTSPPNRGVKIDWTAVRERLSAAAAASEGASRPSSEAARRVLDERAKRLARPTEQARSTAGAHSVLSFSLGRERYVVESRFVREVFRLTELAFLPQTPDFVVGVTNLHGEILVVFDLQLFFGFAAKGLTDRAHVVTCAGERTEFGIVADAVHEVTSLAAEDVRPDTIFEGARGRECIRGVTRDAALFVDLPALIRHPELAIGRSNEIRSGEYRQEAP